MSDKFGYQILCYDTEDSRQRPVHVGSQGGLDHSAAVWINNDGVSVTGIGGASLATEDNQDQMLIYLDDIGTSVGTLWGPEVYNGGGLKQALFSEKNELLTSTYASSSASRIVYESGTITKTTYALVVDLDNSGGQWPHTYSGTSHIHLDCLENDIVFDSNNGECSIEYGLITRIDGTDADIYYLCNNKYANSTAKTSINNFRNYQPSAVLFNVDSGLPKGALTNKFETTSLINTGTSILNPSPDTVYPGLGDMIVKYTYDSVDFSCTLDILYHTD